MARYTDEQREFITSYGDYPCWVILDAYRERFPGAPVPDRTYISKLRIEARGTTNRHSKLSRLRTA